MASPMTIRAYMRLFLRICWASGDERILEFFVLLGCEELTRDQIALVPIWAAIDDLLGNGTSDSDSDNVRFCSGVYVHYLQRIDRLDGCSRHLFYLCAERHRANQS